MRTAKPHVSPVRQPLPAVIPAKLIFFLRMEYAPVNLPGWYTRQTALRAAQRTPT